MPLKVAGEKVANMRSRRLIAPRQLGPSNAIPPSAASRTIWSCSAKPWSPASAKRLVDHLSQLSVKELNELKKEWEELLDKEDRKAILMKKMANKGLV